MAAMRVEEYHWVPWVRQDRQAQREFIERVKSDLAVNSDEPFEGQIYVHKNGVSIYDEPGEVLDLGLGISAQEFVRNDKRKVDVRWGTQRVILNKDGDTALVLPRRGLIAVTSFEDEGLFDSGDQPGPFSDVTIVK